MASRTWSRASDPAESERGLPWPGGWCPPASARESGAFRPGKAKRRPGHRPAPAHRPRPCSRGRQAATAATRTESTCARAFRSCPGRGVARHEAPCAPKKTVRMAPTLPATLEPGAPRDGCTRPGSCRCSRRQSTSEPEAPGLDGMHRVRSRPLDARQRDTARSATRARAWSCAILAPWPFGCRLARPARVENKHPLRQHLLALSCRGMGLEVRRERVLELQGETTPDESGAVDRVDGRFSVWPAPAHGQGAGPPSGRRRPESVRRKGVC